MSDEVPHKLAFRVTEAGQKLEISDLKEEEVLYYLSSENKGTDELCSYCTADLRLSIGIGTNPV